MRRAVSKTSEEQVQKDKQMLVLDDVDVVVVVVWGSLVKETMPLRQRGHGTEPGVAFDVFDDVMFVVLRYNAQFVQNS